MRTNHWVCESCGKSTIGVHRNGDEAGVTPFMMACRATRGCRGDALSRFYQVPEASRDEAHVEWYVPDADELEAALVEQPEHAEWITDHVANGGALMRDLRP